MQTFGRGGPPASLLVCAASRASRPGGLGVLMIVSYRECIQIPAKAGAT